MRKIGGLAILMIGLGIALVSGGQTRQDAWRQGCINKCITTNIVDPELQRQEIVSLERETARAIQLNNGAFFRRVYSDDFVGTLSHGQTVDRAAWVAVIESPSVKYESFIASDIKVRLYQEMAVATCLWSSRSTIKGQSVTHQMRAIHVYLNGMSGWHVISGQDTNLPPDVGQPL
jgi:hypothetical protein